MSQTPISFLDLIAAEQQRQVAKAIEAFAAADRGSTSGPDTGLLASA